MYQDVNDMMKPIKNCPFNYYVIIYFRFGLKKKKKHV